MTLAVYIVLQQRVINTQLGGCWPFLEILYISQMSKYFIVVTVSIPQVIYKSNGTASVA
jgi:hypothetical protein